VCATSATNLGIRCTGQGKHRENGVRRATNPNIRRAEMGQNSTKMGCMRDARDKSSDSSRRIWQKSEK
jgi:hypothetical protein